MFARLLSLAAVLILALPGMADEKNAKEKRAEENEPATLWTFEGYARLPAAAADAKKNGRRLLLGLSGSPT